METNWNYVKTTTLWQYEDLIKKLQFVLAYPFIRQHYHYTMPQAVAFLQRLILPADWEQSDHWPALVTTFARLDDAGVQDYADLVARVATRAQCLEFLDRSGLEFTRLIDVLNCLLRWLLPFYTATRELLQHGDPREMANYMILKQHKLMASFDLIEHGRTHAGRQNLAAQTGLPDHVLTTLVHRADIARLPYVRRKTILPLCGAGYDTLAKIATADLPRMEAALEAYFQRTEGKPWEAYKSVIILRGLVRGAQALPAIVEAA